MKMYTMTENEMEATLNHVKELLFFRLESDKVIHSAGDLSLKYLITLHQKGRFGKIWDKVWNKTDGDIVILKIDNGK